MAAPHAQQCVLRYAPLDAAHLRRLARARLALHDDDLVRLHQRVQLVQELPDRQLFALLVDVPVPLRVRLAVQRVGRGNRAIATQGSCSAAARRRRGRRGAADGSLVAEVNAPPAVCHRAVMTAGNVMNAMSSRKVVVGHWRAE